MGTMGSGRTADPRESAMVRRRVLSSLMSCTSHSHRSLLGQFRLAGEKGSFPKFDQGKYMQGAFTKQLPEHVRQYIKEHGMRNVCVLTQAPTGITGTMIGTSTGIEPYYSWTYWRKGRLGEP